MTKTQAWEQFEYLKQLIKIHKNKTNVDMKYINKLQLDLQNVDDILQNEDYDDDDELEFISDEETAYQEYANQEMRFIVNSY